MLARCGYAFHPVLKGILCISCQGIIKPKANSSLLNHLKKHHSNIKLPKPVKDKLAPKLTELGALDQPEQIDIDVSMIAPLTGIKIERGYMCEVLDPRSGRRCMAGTTSNADMNRHLGQHPKILRPSMDTRFQEVSIQRIYLRSTQCIIVNPALATVDEDHISSYRVITQALLPSLPPPPTLVHESDKDRPPILKHTGFDLLLADALQQDHGAEDLVFLGSLPGTYCSEGYLENLTDIGEKWIQECRKQHRGVDKFIQRMLGGGYPRYVYRSVQTE